MKIQIKDGRVTFGGQTLQDAEFDLQFKSNDLISKIDNEYTLQELIEMTKAKGRAMGLNIDFVTQEYPRL